MSDTAVKSTPKTVLAGQVSRFAVIGLIATGVHVLAASLSHYAFGLSPLMANFVGFLFAWSVSFAGHYFWTFDKLATMRQAMPRFFLISICGFGLNQAIVWFVVEVLGRSFALAMVLAVIIIPAASFLSSKFWAFRRR